MYHSDTAETKKWLQDTDETYQEVLMQMKLCMEWVFQDWTPYMYMNGTATKWGVFKAFVVFFLCKKASVLILRWDMTVSQEIRKK